MRENFRQRSSLSSGKCGRAGGFGRLALSALIVLNLSLQARAQTPPPAPTPPAATDKVKTAGPRKQLATIVFAGLGGAILGLSTLSFYGRPQDKLSNIAIGFAIGVISGTAFVTFNAATNPREFYGGAEKQKMFAPEAPETLSASTQLNVPLISYEWSFQ